MNRRTFWLTAPVAAGVFAALAAIALPYGMLGLDSEAERIRGWLLTVWTAGVLAICFGASGLLGGLLPITFRDVAEAGSVGAAIDARRDARRSESSPFYNFAGWLVTTGAFLLLVYFAGWVAT